MNPVKILRIPLASIAMLTFAAAPALAEWRWVEEAPTTRTETHVYEEHQAPPDYYQQAPRTYEQAPPTYYEAQPPTYYEGPPAHGYVHESYAPVVTNREVIHDGRCEVTRTYMSDGTTSDDRRCTRLLWPHEYIIDSIGRHFDRWRYNHDIPY
jgi:hypothetical protein